MEEAIRDPSWFHCIFPRHLIDKWRKKRFLSRCLKNTKISCLIKWLFINWFNITIPIQITWFWFFFCIIFYPVLSRFCLFSSSKFSLNIYWKKYFFCFCHFWVILIFALLYRCLKSRQRGILDTKFMIFFSLIIYV